MLDVSCAGRVALISGGNRGIGRACALALAGAGAKVSIGYRSNAEAAEATVLEIRALVVAERDVDLAVVAPVPDRKAAIHAA